MELVTGILRRLACKHGIAVGLYRRFCHPSGYEWAAFLKARNVLYSMGEHCFVMPGTTIADPSYTRLGNNVMLSSCSIFAHDGSVAMLNRAYAKCLDYVEKVDIKDNVFVGNGAIVLPGVTIGPNALVAAGAVVTHDVPENTVVAGVPARVIAALDEYVGRLEERCVKYSWMPLIRQRGISGYDPELEPELRRMRQEFFFGPGERNV